MKSLSKGVLISIFLFVVLLPDVCLGITATALKRFLDNGGKVTIIDVRSSSDYMSGHIPNAINIPARIIAVKSLPPIGRVIVCGDGVNKGETLEAVRALNEKSGIQAEILKGGFSVWNAQEFQSTRKVGITRERFRYITLQELKKALASNRDIVLVDMRTARAVKKQALSGKPADSDEALTDLSEKFPGVEVVTLDRKKLCSGGKGGDISIAAISGIKGSGNNHVYVLIDNGDGRAKKIARRLNASGMKQVLIMVGGEEMLQRNGRPGFRTEVTGN